MKYIEKEKRVDGNKLRYRLYKKNSDKLLVLLNGLRAKNSITKIFYNRVSWVDEMNYNCLYISDPTLLYYPQLRGGYYQGTKNNNILEFISQFIEEMAFNLSVNKKNILIYGSSQGGFAALMLNRYLNKSQILAECPQVDLSILSSPSTKNDRLAMLKHVYEVDSYCELNDSDIQKINVIECYKSNSVLTNNINILVKNTDVIHINDHIKPLTLLYPDIKLEIISGDYGKGGHSGMDKKIIIEKIAKCFD